MIRRVSPPKVFFNASVILSGIRSPSGGSGKILQWVKNQTIIGVVSEIIVSEALRHAARIDKEKEDLQKDIISIFPTIFPPPSTGAVQRFRSVVIDPDDAHVLAASVEYECDMLVTLDRKHLLVLQKTIQNIAIFSPGELIEHFCRIEAKVQRKLHHSSCSKKLK